jgi:mannosyltransferase
MSLYPNFDQWRALIIDQHSGLLAWCFIVVSLFLIWASSLWKWKPIRRDIVILGVGLVLASIVIPAVTTFSLPSLSLRRGIMLLIAFPVAIYGFFRINDLNPQWDVLLIALLIRIPGLFIEPFWYDEVTTAAFAQLPLSSIGALAGDTHPPLFYLAQWIAAHTLGTSEIALRVPSLLFGVLTVYLIYRLTLALGMESKTALVAALIVAVLPGALRYSNEARGYAQLAALVLGMVICVLEDRPRWFAGLAAATILTHNMGYVYVATIGGAAFFMHVHRIKVLSVIKPEGMYNYWNPGPFQLYINLRTKRWWWALLIPAAVGLAWLPFMLRQLQSISDGWWAVSTPGGLVSPLFSMTIGSRITEPLLLQSLAVVLIITLVALGTRFKWLPTTNGLLWVVLVFGTPLVAALISIITPVYVDRAFLPSMLAIPIVWAYLLTQRPTYQRIAAAALIVPVLAIAMYSYYAPDRSIRPDWRTLLTEGCGDTPVIFNTSLSTYMLARYYLPEARVIAWSGANDINLFLPEATKQALGIEQATAPPAGIVCVLDFETLLSRQDERAYATRLITHNEHSDRVELFSTAWSDTSAFIVRFR